MATDPLLRPLLRLHLVLHSGEELTHDWTMANLDMGQPAPDMDALHRDWMLEPRKVWTHPQDPVTHSALVAEGHEDDARKLMQSLAAKETPIPEDGEGE